MSDRFEGLSKWSKGLANAPETDHTTYFDKWGACKVCGGEIPDGHRLDCAVYQLEKKCQEHAALVEAVGEMADEDWDCVMGAGSVRRVIAAFKALTTEAPAADREGES